MRIGLLIVLMAFNVCLFAQEKESLPREVLSPEKLARKEANRLKKELTLTDKQYNKVYKLELKEMKSLFTDTQSSDMQRPPMGERGGMGAPPPGGGGRPPMGGGASGAPTMRNGSQQGVTKTPQDAAKARASKEKKMKKILSSSQYEEWLVMKPVLPSHPRGERSENPHSF